jgi:ribosomal protein S18 acetylase RimI-like enzyme
LTFAQAKPTDWSVIAVILEDAQRWLRSRDIPQWIPPFDRDWMEPKIAAGEFFIARLGHYPVAVVRLLRADPFFWGERDDGDALYIHSLAVRREYAGRGLGQQILEWVGDAARGSGRHYLRLDCAADNQSLCAYYERAGFVTLGSIEVGHARMMLFEKAVA